MAKRTYDETTVAKLAIKLSAAVRSTTADGCRLAPGLGPIYCAGSLFTPARAAWAVAHAGEVDGNVYLTCKSPDCINPQHMSCGAGTNHGRRRSNWTARDVAAIKHNLATLMDAGLTATTAATVLGAHFGVDLSYVKAIANGSALRDLQSTVDPFEPGKLAHSEGRASSLGAELEADPGTSDEWVLAPRHPRQGAG